jgi:hypothetical protein
VVGFLLAVLFREFDRGNISAGVSYGFPFKGKWRFVPQLYAQYLDGYEETSTRSDTLTRAFRMGLRFMR